MKVSRTWLQTFFSAPLPDAQTIGDALTFHAFEIETIEQAGGDSVLDVKITANRGHDCLSHRGIAKELSAILQNPLNTEVDPFSKTPDFSKTTDAVAVSIDASAGLCKRYIAGYVRGVKVGPSPEWLKQSLETIGQRSINNIVDATNYVMFGIGQPLHAFDAGQLQANAGTYAIEVRPAREGEKMLALDEKEYALSPANLVIADKNANAAIGIAGVKGGKPAGISEATHDIIIESANFDGVSVRKTAQALKLRTDASARFEQVISPEVAGYGMRQVAELIVSLAGGELAGFVDVYPDKATNAPVTVSLAKMNAVLGITLSAEEVAEVFRHLGFSFTQATGVFTVLPPIERLDLLIAEDLIEEVGRIIGYDRVPATPLPPTADAPEINPRFYAAEHLREELMGKGYSEVFTSVFSERGEHVVLNKVDGVRPYLRSTLVDGLKEAYERNTKIKEILGLKEVRLFEIGVVWKGGAEVLMLATADKTGVREETLPEVPAGSTYESLPISNAVRYAPFSKYPFIVRDISMWVPDNADSFGDVIRLFGEHSQGLLRHVDLFDQFKKEGRVSYAFHLVFQSFDRTLTDVEANAIMEVIKHAVEEKGFTVR